MCKRKRGFHAFSRELRAPGWRGLFRLGELTEADADLDGIVGNSDVTIVGGKFGAAGSGEWYFGDFDYSGSCDNADVTALGGLFNPSAPPLSSEQLSAQFGSAFAAAFEGGASGSAVPEPASLVLVGLGGLTLLAKRRRKQA